MNLENVPKILKYLRIWDFCKDQRNLENAKKIRELLKMFIEVLQMFQEILKMFVRTRF